MISKEMIDRFMRNESTDEERTAVLHYFDEHPEEWDLYFNHEDWQQLSSDREEPLPSSEKMRRAIDWKVRRRPRLIRVTTFAATFILLVAAWIVFYHPSASKDLRVARLETPASATAIKRQTNPTDKTIDIILTDGTRIELAPESAIEYAEGLVTDGKRLVTLTGKAVFHVAKDRNKPFVVLSEGIATTVLGTVFSVEARAATGFVTVDLLEGKIVVRPADSTAKETFQPAWLSPGDRLVYNRNTGNALVYHSNPNSEKLVKTTYNKEKNTSAIKPDWYMFEGEALPEILDQLSVYFKVDIYYYPSQLRNKYFTGKIQKNDSLDAILADIALLNNLSMKKANGTYTITLKSP